MKPTRKKAKKRVTEIALTGYHVDSFNVVVKMQTRQASSQFIRSEPVTHRTDSGLSVMYTETATLEGEQPMNTAMNQISVLTGPISGGLPQIPGVVIIRKRPRPRSEQGPVLPSTQATK